MSDDSGQRTYAVQFSEEELFDFLAQLFDHRTTLDNQIALFVAMLGNDSDAEQRFRDYAASQYGTALKPGVLESYRDYMVDGNVASETPTSPEPEEEIPPLVRKNFH